MLSLKAYDLYIFIPLWQQVTKKFLENAQYYIVSQAWSSVGCVEIAPQTKTSVDVDGAEGVGAGAGCTGAVGAAAGADEVALVSVTGSEALWQMHQQLSCPSSPACHPVAAPQLTESQLL